ncbi:MAG TPA: hypothetical protein DCR97_07285 [Deltaproteobacteria bacterium]|nr:hypothetical protein [Deltaproteobacteria bacterium]
MSSIIFLSLQGTKVYIVDKNDQVLKSEVSDNGAKAVTKAILTAEDEPINVRVVGPLMTAAPPKKAYPKTMSCNRYAVPRGRQADLRQGYHRDPATGSPRTF